MYLVQDLYLTLKSLVEIRAGLIVPGPPHRESPVPVRVHPSLPTSFLTSCSRVASRQGSPVGFMLRRAGALGRLPWARLSAFPQVQASVSSEGAACEWTALPPLLVGRTLSPLLHSGFYAWSCPAPQWQLTGWVLDNYHWLDWAFRLFWEAI